VAAVGATQTEILVQFLTEAITLSLMGGVGAIAFIQVTILVIVNTFDLPYQFNPKTPLFAFASALVVEVGQGLSPPGKPVSLNLCRRCGHRNEGRNAGGRRQKGRKGVGKD
jgi:hypothetical protein